MKKYFLFLVVLFFVTSCRKPQDKYEATWQSTVVSYDFPLFYFDYFTVKSDATAYHVFKITSPEKYPVVKNDFKKIVARYKEGYVPVTMDFFNQDAQGYVVSLSLADSIFVKGKTNHAFKIKSNVKTIEGKIFKHYDSIVNDLKFILIMKNGDSLPVKKSKNFGIKMERNYPEQ